MKLELQLRRDAGKRKPRILSASMNYEKVKAVQGVMRGLGYQADGAIRQSEVTGDWYQWWHLIEEPERLSARRDGLVPMVH